MPRSLTTLRYQLKDACLTYEEQLNPEMGATVKELLETETLIDDLVTKLAMAINIQALRKSTDGDGVVDAMGSALADLAEAVLSQMDDEPEA